ncbi:MAG: NfeD family protein [Candidatus Methanofastidiosia archaeon]|jgi:membrane-bound serine protease (ClpP class)
MIEKKEIAFRVIIFSVIYVLIAVVVLVYIEMEWLLIPACSIIFVWGIYVYRMNVKVLTMPSQISQIEGRTGRALTDIDPEGKVKVSGEIWNAQSKYTIKKGEYITVVTRKGITLEVEPVAD